MFSLSQTISKNAAIVQNLPSELTDLSASVWAANAFVRSNSNSWNCFDSTVVSTDRRVLQNNLIKNRIFINIWNSKCETTKKCRDLWLTWTEAVKLSYFMAAWNGGIEDNIDAFTTRLRPSHWSASEKHASCIAVRDGRRTWGAADPHQKYMC